MSYLRTAFYEILTEAKPTETWYVCLMLKTTYYGGPEEGGWWGNDSMCVAYQEFASEDLAASAAERINKLAEELSNTAKHEYGNHCLRQMNWLYDRGLDSDYLPENDGPDDYYTCVMQEVPEPTHGERSYS